MKTAKKGENDEFFVMSLKHGSVLTCLVNRPGTLKLWSISLMKTTKNRENGEFFIMPLKHVSDLTGHVNRPGTLKL